MRSYVHHTAETDKQFSLEALKESSSVLIKPQQNVNKRPIYSLSISANQSVVLTETVNRLV